FYVVQIFLLALANFLNIIHINYKFLELINGGNTIFYPKK
ncbi:MAG: hypothetical protein RL363_255, partial [Bacteroidota bacterium]